MDSVACHASITWGEGQFSFFPYKDFVTRAHLQALTRQAVAPIARDANGWPGSGPTAPKNRALPPSRLTDTSPLSSSRYTDTQIQIQMQMQIVNRTNELPQEIEQTIYPAAVPRTRELDQQWTTRIPTIAAWSMPDQGLRCTISTSYLGQTPIRTATLHAMKCPSKPGGLLTSIARTRLIY
ncbi:uncharacterized protein LOC123257500 [Drosophila ananassae]|uniref:uncharacterized protein LOC123257500 n=1 Tax=Drosophila ananassae TaxID=7217 RepID=UPI001CFF7314|nr:uncharacterized protein LOC123257500 [Drosophila ananassae]